MGITEVDLQIANITEPEWSETLKFMVDSSAVYSVVPTVVLERLGVTPYREEVFRLANGDHIRRRKGAALFTFGARVGVADVVFGEAGDAQLLGALTLESLGLLLDPLKRELRELPMLL